jgi:uncharacterized integral membrane protein
MKTLVHLLSSVIIAVCLVAIAIISNQNITLVSLQFLSFKSIQLPVGLLFAISAGTGMIAGVIIPLFWRRSPQRQPKVRRAKYPNLQQEEEEEDPLEDWTDYAPREW